MKKILAIILSVMMVASLAVLASAEEAPLTTTLLTAASEYTTITVTPVNTTVTAKGDKIVVNYVLSNNAGIMALTMGRLSAIVPAGLALVEEKDGGLFGTPTTGADKIVYLDANGDNKSNGVLYTATYEVTADVKKGDSFTFSVPTIAAGNMDEQVVQVNCVNATVNVVCPHKTTEVKNAVEAKCDTEGYTGDTYCTVCGEKLAEGKKIEMKAHAHTQVKDKVDADCTKSGYTGDTYCLDCGKKIADGTVVGKLLHTGGTATCTKKAVCTLCKQEYGNVNANNHPGTTKIVNTKAATSTTEGYTGDTVCTDCNAVVKSGEVIAKIINPPTNDNSIVTVVVIAVLGIAAIAGAAVVYNKRREF